MAPDPITIAALVYRDARWIHFLREGLEAAATSVDWRLMVVGNDAAPEVMRSGVVDVDHRNPNPGEHYIARVYRAWNRAVAEAPTERVVLINSDMYVSDRWLEALAAAPEGTLPTSLLVESGRIPSAFPEYVRNFGLTPDTFDRVAWREHAKALRERASAETAPGRLFMPILFRKRDFLEAGGYPEGNPGGRSGDAVFFERMAARGLRHVTCLRSICYHVQEGEGQA